MPHKWYQGKTGVVWNVTKRALGVEINKRVSVCVQGCAASSVPLPLIAPVAEAAAAGAAVEQEQQADTEAVLRERGCSVCHSSQLWQQWEEHVHLHREIWARARKGPSSSSCSYHAVFVPTCSKYIQNMLCV